MAYAPHHSNLAKLDGVVQLLEAAERIDQRFELQPRLLARLPGGELYLDSELQLDTDGWDAPPGHADAAHQEHTSLRYRDHASLDANAVPYFVLPLPPRWPARFGIALGDYAAVLYKGNLAYAVFGDEGPADKIGEGSIELFRQLGQERIKRDGSVWDTGMGPAVVTIVFPGSGKGQRAFADQAALLDDMRALGQQRFEAIGGRPNG